MSVKAVSWALDDVTGINPTQKLILIIMSEVASTDGSGSYCSHATIAAKAGISDRQVRTQLKVLQELGLIRRGDQRHVSHIPANYRPTVYDMVMEPEHRLSAIAAASVRKPASGLEGKLTSGLDRKFSAGRAEVRGEASFLLTNKPKEKPAPAESVTAECRDCGREKDADEITGSGLCADCLPQPPAPRPTPQLGRSYQDYLRARNDAKEAREPVPNDFDAWQAQRPVLASHAANDGVS